MREKRLHPDYRIVGYDSTSRVYSTNPSLSQIPKPVRYSFVPSSGKKFLYFDLKAAELFIMLKWAGCTELVEAYETGQDLYAVIARRILGKESIQKSERDMVKVVVLSLIYGSEGGASARVLHISEEEAKGIIDKFYQAYPEIVVFQRKAYEYVLRNGYICTFCFRPRILQENSEDDSQRRRRSLNTSVQGTCADLVKKCIAKIPLDGVVNFVTTVFDSVLLEVPEDFTDQQAVEFIDQFLEPALPFKFRYEWAFGDSWGDAQAKV